MEVLDVEVRDLASRVREVVARLNRRLRPTRAGAGLSPTERTVLGSVSKSGPVCLSELAAAEDLNPTMLSRVAAALERQGLVSRTQDPEDKRSYLLDATPSGRRLLDKMRSERNDALAARLAQLGPRQRARLLDALPVLETLAEALKDRRP
ncbi:MAG TPA: MarR family transcriptional regulator [Acidimicrobiales bacterium]|nr:MarR family transcriptional regulator [Acidimicrobiales bacterium]